MSKLLKLYFIIFLLLKTILLFSQNNFIHFYPGIKVYEVIEEEGGFKSIGVGYNSQEDHLNLQINDIYLDGEIYDSISFNLNADGSIYTYSTYSINKIEDKYYCVSGIIGSFNDYEMTPYLVCLDSNNDTLFTKNYKNILPGNFSKLLIVEEALSGLILVGLDYDSRDAFLALADYSGNTNTQFSISGNSDSYLYPNQIIYHDTTGYVILFEETYFENGNGDLEHVKARIISLNLDGQVLWDYYLGSSLSKNYSPRGIRIDEDKYFLAWTDPFWDGVNAYSNPYTRIWTSQIDAGLLCESEMLYEFLDSSYPAFEHYIMDIIVKSEEIYICGYFHNYPNTGGFLAKINFEQELLWYKRYNGNDTIVDETEVKTYFYDLKETSDGGFVIGGEYIQMNNGQSTPFIQCGLIVKVDSCGCFDSCCDNSDYSLIDIGFDEMLVFPNPANEFISFSIPIVCKQYQCDIISTNGQTIKSNKICGNECTIQVNDIPPGQYYIKLYFETKKKTYIGKFIKI
ncbi:MAG: T9SS type A sorting domain-containing protein [Bacteroidales bacterium]|nr:T9SS type A sorting domain-containing protein [Bacteroidales bacterium]